MSNYGPPGAGSAGPWPGRRPDDAYGEPVTPWPDRRPDDAYARPAAAWPGGDDWERPQPGYPADDRWPPEAYRPAPAHPGDRYASDHRYADDRYPSPPHDGDHYASQPPGDSRYARDPYPYPPAPDRRFGGDAAPPGPPARRRRGRGLLVAVLATLLVLLGGGALTWYLSGRGDPPPAVEAAPTPDATQGDPDTAGTPTAAPTVAAPESSADPRFVQEGQCVRNDGPAGGKPKLVISPCGPKTYEVLRRIDGPTSGETDAETKCAKVEGYTNWYFFDSQLDTLDFVLCLKLR